MSHFWHKPLTLAASLLVVFAMMGMGGASVASAKGSLTFSDYEGPHTANPAQLTVVVELSIANETLPFGQGPFYNQKVKLESGFLTGTPNPSNGGKTYTVSIRNGIKWSNGHALTNKDLLFGWKVYMNAGYCSGYCDIINGMSLKGSNKVVFHLSAPAPPAVFYTNDFPPFIPSFWTRITSKKNLDACLASKGPSSDGGFSACGPAAKTITGDATFNYHDSSYLTAGPYKISSWGGTPSGSKITFVPNKYWRGSWVGGCCVKGNNGPPRLSQAVFQLYATQQGMITAAASGGTDVTSDYTLANVATLKKFSGGRYKIITPGTFNLESAFFNVFNKTVSVYDNANHTVYHGKNPVANVKVRLALALAFDRAKLISYAYKAPLKVAKKLVSYSSPVANDTDKPHDPWGDKSIKGAWDPIKKKYEAPGSKTAMADAKKLLKQAGYSSKHKANIYITSNINGNPTRDSEALFLHNAWNKLGSVNVHVVDVEESSVGGTFLNTWTQKGTVAHGHYMIAIFEFALGSPDPQGWQADVVSSKCPQTEKNSKQLDADANWSCIKNGKIDSDFNKAGRTSNDSLRHKYFNDFQTQMVKNAYWVSLAMKPNIETYDKKAQNIVGSAFSSGTPNWDAWDWSAKS